jgi:hypothetical protein
MAFLEITKASARPSLTPQFPQCLRQQHGAAVFVQFRLGVARRRRHSRPRGATVSPIFPFAQWTYSWQRRHGVFTFEGQQIVKGKFATSRFDQKLGPGTTISPNFGQIRALVWNEKSFYHALQMAVQNRVTRGLHLNGSFTWSKSIDSGSATVADDQFSNSIGSLPFCDLRLSRGLSDFNIGRKFVVNAVWDIPAPKRNLGFAGWLVAGWELGGIYTASDGVPFTATFGTDGDPLGLNSSDPWDVPSRLAKPGCRSLVNPGDPNNYIKTQCFEIPTAPSLSFYNQNCDTSMGAYPQCFNLRGNAGRNILIGPGTSNLDFLLFKSIPISEGFNIQFRTEAFNVLNHPNFSVPVTPDNTDIFDSTGAPSPNAGLLTSTTTTSREIQFGLKLTW